MYHWLLFNTFLCCPRNFITCSSNFIDERTKFRELFILRSLSMTDTLKLTEKISLAVSSLVSLSESMSPQIFEMKNSVKFENFILFFGDIRMNYNTFN